MEVAERIRVIRQEKRLSQGDIEKRTGLLRCYISRVENGHTVPAVETLEKICRALEVPLYQLFYDGDALPEKPIPSEDHEDDWASHGKGRRMFAKLRGLLKYTNEADRELLLRLAKEMPHRKRRAHS